MNMIEKEKLENIYNSAILTIVSAMVFIVLYGVGHIFGSELLTLISFYMIAITAILMFATVLMMIFEED